MCFLLLLFLSSSGISRIRPSGKRWEKRREMLLETSISFRNRLSLFPYSPISFARQLPRSSLLFPSTLICPSSSLLLLIRLFLLLLLYRTQLPSCSVSEILYFFIFLRHLTIPSCSCCTRRWCILFFFARPWRLGQFDQPKHWRAFNNNEDGMRKKHKGKKGTTQFGLASLSRNPFIHFWVQPRRERETPLLPRDATPPPGGYRQSRDRLYCQCRTLRWIRAAPLSYIDPKLDIYIQKE